ncbi:MULTISPECIES: nuclear transport factor 2 family protein [unclassified Caballeronia]|uniref:nuclear transport factor 2 family protein n=1 Tax=unclassified Caballeronia TaxID=2646786 RepID=UPI0020289151|nr:MULTISPECIES: nuclear transport factor 2 family protein [unclassified Caballeronia]
MTEKEAVALLQRFSEGWNRHDVDGLMACMSPDCTYHAAAGAEKEGQSFHGEAAVRDAFVSIFEKFPDAQWRNSVHVALGNRGFSEWLFTATDRSTNSAVAVHGVDVFVLKDGKIAVKDTFRKQVLRV